MAAYALSRYHSRKKIDALAPMALPDRIDAGDTGRGGMVGLGFPCKDGKTRRCWL